MMMTSALSANRLLLALIAGFGLFLFVTGVAGAQTPTDGVSLPSIPIVDGVAPQLPQAGAPSGLAPDIVNQVQAAAPDLPAVAPPAGAPEVPRVDPSAGFGLPAPPALPADPGVPTVVQQTLSLTDATPTNATGTPGWPRAADPRPAPVPHSEPVDSTITGGFGDASATAPVGGQSSVEVVPGNGLFGGQPESARPVAPAAGGTLVGLGEEAAPESAPSRSGLFDPVRRIVGTILPDNLDFRAVTSYAEGLLLITMLAAVLVVLLAVLMLALSAALAPRRVGREPGEPFGDYARRLLTFYSGRYRATLADEGIGEEPPGPLVRQLMAFYSGTGPQRSR